MFPRFICLSFGLSFGFGLGLGKEKVRLINYLNLIYPSFY